MNYNYRTEPNWWLVGLMLFIILACGIAIGLLI